MKKISSVLRTLAASAGLLAVAACVANISFDITKDAAVDAPGTSLATTIPVDLSQSKEIQDHKSNVQGLSFDSMDLTVTAVGATNHATSVDGTISLRAAGAPADG